MAQLLHSLARMVQPRTILEYGSRAIQRSFFCLSAENVADFAEEAESLRGKNGYGNCRKRFNYLTEGTLFAAGTMGFN